MAGDERPPRQLAVERQGLRMHGIEWLDLIGYKMDELRERGFDTGRIAGGVSRAHQYAVQPLIVRGYPQTLQCRPLGAGGVVCFQTIMGVSKCQIHDPCLDRGENALE